MKRMLLYIATILMILSCENANNKQKQTDDVSKIKKELGKYLYMSKDSVLHTSKDCLKLRGMLDDNFKTYGVQFYRTAYFCPTHQFWYCEECFSDELYEQVDSLINSNLPADSAALELDGLPSYEHTRALHY